MGIRSARAAHIRWKAYIQIALRGIVTSHTENTLPIVHTECEFGRWYYGKGMDLSMSPNYQNLEIPHEMLHESYIQIYTLQKAKLRGGFFTSKRKLLRKRQEEIMNLLANLNDYSRIISESMHQLELEVLNMTDEEIRKLTDMTEESSFTDDFDYFIKKID